MGFGFGFGHDLHFSVKSEEAPESPGKERGLHEMGLATREILESHSFEFHGSCHKSGGGRRFGLYTIPRSAGLNPSGNRVVSS